MEIYLLFYRLIRGFNSMLVFGSKPRFLIMFTQKNDEIQKKHQEKKLRKKMTLDRREKK